MKITIGSEQNYILVSLEGSLDTSSAPQLDRELTKIIKGKRVNLILDFKNLKYLTSAGLRVLLSAQKMVNEMVGIMIVRNVNPTIMEMFESTGFSEFLTISNDGEPLP